MSRLAPAQAETQVTEGGFTLVELLVVVALIALVSVLAAPGIGNIFRISLNATAREMASITKEAYNSAAMTGKVYRLVYDIKEREYWVESGPPTALLDSAESKERDEARARLTKKEKPKETGFAMDRTVTRKKMSLPRGVEFEDIITEQSPDPVKEGTVYTHFFPHGIAEQTVIHLVDSSKNQVTLVITPITGKTRLFLRYATKEDIYGQ